uniref:Uncharacterized protein n=1 Tax=Noctiluca scintillans TaxID=2966 RepID=A0A7S0ZSA3_NOCSC
MMMAMFCAGSRSLWFGQCWIYVCKGPWLLFQDLVQSVLQQLPPPEQRLEACPRKSVCSHQATQSQHFSSQTQMPERCHWTDIVKSIDDETSVPSDVFNVMSRLGSEARGRGQHMLVWVDQEGSRNGTVGHWRLQQWKRDKA